MRRPILILLVLIGLVLGVAACGSDQTASDEVPGSPPTLPIPTSSEDDRDPLADASPRDEEKPSDDKTSGDEDDETSSTTDTGTSTDGTTAEPAPAPETQGTTGGTGTQTDTQTGGETGGTPTQGGQDTAENDQPPGNGTGAQKFEEFCEQNDGAC